MVANSYYNPRIREICHGIKENNPECIYAMVDFVLNSDIVKAGDILIPAPQHQGYAIYTKVISELIAKESGAVVKDIIKSNPRETLYANRNTPLNFYATEKILSDNNHKIYFVDNVICTGKTFRAVQNLLNLPTELSFLVYGKV